MRRFCKGNVSSNIFVSVCSQWGGLSKEISCSSEVPSVRLVGGDGEGRHVVGAEIGSSYVAGTLTSGQLAFT